MHTTVEIDADLMTEAMSEIGLSTAEEVVELALRTLLRMKRQSSVLALAGEVEWDGDLDARRETRFPKWTLAD